MSDLEPLLPSEPQSQPQAPLTECYEAKGPSNSGIEQTRDEPPAVWTSKEVLDTWGFPTIQYEEFDPSVEKPKSDDLYDSDEVHPKLEGTISRAKDNDSMHITAARASTYHHKCYHCSRPLTLKNTSSYTPHQSNGYIPHPYLASCSGGCETTTANSSAADGCTTYPGLCQFKKEEDEAVGRIIAEVQKLLQMRMPLDFRSEAFQVYNRAERVLELIQGEKLKAIEAIHETEESCDHESPKECQNMCKWCGKQYQHCRCSPTCRRCKKDQDDAQRAHTGDTSSDCSEPDQDREDKCFVYMCPDCEEPRETCVCSMCDTCHIPREATRENHYHARCFCHHCPACGLYPQECRYYSANNQFVHPQYRRYRIEDDEPNSALPRIVPVKQERREDGMIYVSVENVSRIVMVPKVSAAWDIVKYNAKRRVESIPDFFTENFARLQRITQSKLPSPLFQTMRKLTRAVLFLDWREARATARAAKEREAAARKKQADVRDALREANDPHQTETHIHVWEPSHVVEMIDAICDSDPLGIDLEGDNLGREGITAYIQIRDAAKGVTYIVDICALGSSAFDIQGTQGQSLRSILEDEDRRILFWDVRQDSDALFSGFGIRIAGALDLQIMHLIHRDSQPSQAWRCSLADWVGGHQGLLGMTEDEEYAWCQSKKYPFGKNYSRFLERPVERVLIEYMVGDANILPRIYEHLRGKISEKQMDAVRRLTMLEVSNTQRFYFQSTQARFASWYDKEWRLGRQEAAASGAITSELEVGMGEWAIVPLS